MKLRLTQAGFEKYTGQMGVIMFENGLSVGEVLPIDGIRIAAAIGATWEDGSAANVGDMYLNNMNVPAFVGNGTSEIANEPVDNSSKEIKKEKKTYSEKELEAVADESGIAGLRAIADTIGVKGTSIVGIIKAIKNAQTKNEAE